LPITTPQFFKTIDLDDVSASTPNDGDALLFNAASGLWEPGAVSGGGGASELDDLTDVAIGTPASEHVLKFNNVGQVWVSGYVDWSEISGKPSAFTPAAHTHSATAIDSGFSPPTNYVATTSDLQGHLEGIDDALASGGASALDDLSDVTIISPGTLQALTYIAGTWRNTTLSTAYIQSGTFSNSRISESSVVQHQAALTITESQITDGSIFPRIAANETITGQYSFTDRAFFSDGSESLPSICFSTDTDCGFFYSSTGGQNTVHLTVGGTEIMRWVDFSGFVSIIAFVGDITTLPLRQTLRARRHTLNSKAAAERLRSSDSMSNQRTGQTTSPYGERPALPAIRPLPFPRLTDRMETYSRRTAQAI
jgi:hypothetical protein